MGDDPSGGTGGQPVKRPVGRTDSGTGATTGSVGPAEPLPATPGDLTRDWLGPVLVAAGETAPRGITVEPLGPGVGFLGDVARVHLDGCGLGSVIVKFPPADPGGRHVGAMLNAWAREHAFYTEVVPRSPGADVPRCFFAGADPGDDRWVLVLEDCPSETLDTASGASQAQAEAAVDAVAAFHARWWQAPAKARFEWMPGFDRIGVGGLQGAWLDAIPLFTNRYGHLAPGDTLAWLASFAAELPAWSDRAATEPLTIVHADYRLDNLRYHDGRMTMLDWQTALRGPGAMDLASFVATSLTIENRQAWEDQLIARYANGLRSAGVEVDDAWLRRSYDENLLWWMGQFANNLARLEPDDPEAQAALDTMIERTYTAGHDRNVGRLLG